jgi:histidine decarboxylase
VKYFITQVKNKTSINIDRCMVHQIRVQINNDEETITPVPEGIHQDGYNFVALMCINRHNILGGINKLYSLDYNDIIQEHEEILSTILKPGEMLFFNDRKVKHFVSNINRSCKDKTDLAYRDILVLTTVF